MALSNLFSNNNCKVCGASAEFEAVYNRIKQSKIQSFDCRKPNLGPTREFPIIQTDTSAKHPQGNAYLYSADPKLHKAKFCSKDCAYSFSVQKNVIVVFNDPEFGRPRMLTPHTEQINTGLGNTGDLKRTLPAGS